MGNPVCLSTYVTKHRETHTGYDSLASHAREMNIFKSIGSKVRFPPFFLPSVECVESDCSVHALWSLSFSTKTARRGQWFSKSAKTLIAYLNPSDSDPIL